MFRAVLWGLRGALAACLMTALPMGLLAGLSIGLSGGARDALEAGVFVLGVGCVLVSPFGFFLGIRDMVRRDRPT
ncbi:MAG: hypothetical protein AB1758_01510 [Candidatus Eremiobacterota bacterium]